MIIERFDSSLNGSSLKERLDQEVALFPEITVNWGHTDWATGDVVGQGLDESIPSASVRKVSMLMGAFAAIRSGSLDAEETFVTKERDYEVDSGIFHRLTPGIRLTYKDALKAMIMLSDNASTVALAERFGGLDYFNRYCGRIGLHQTRHRQALPDQEAAKSTTNLTSVRDTLNLLSLVEAGRYNQKIAGLLECTSEDCETATDIMKKNKLNDRLPFLLPKGVDVAHKTGTLPNADTAVIADVGTVYAPNNGSQPLFSLAVFAQNVPNELENGMPGRAGAATLMARMARISYDAAHKNA